MVGKLRSYMPIKKPKHKKQKQQQRAHVLHYKLNIVKNKKKALYIVAIIVLAALSVVVATILIFSGSMLREYLEANLKTEMLYLIVAIAAFVLDGDSERILAGGCDDYIAKPISIPSFFKTIEKHLQESK